MWLNCAHYSLIIWRDRMMYRWQCVCVLFVVSYDVTEWRTDGSVCVCCWSCHMTWQNDVQMTVCVCVVGRVIWRDRMTYRWQYVCVLFVMSYDVTEWRTDDSMCVCCWSCHMTWQNDVQMAVCVCVVCHVIWRDRMTYRWQCVCVLLVMSYDVTEW